jgi:heptaprenyl diphosphate synthase component 2
MRSLFEAGGKRMRPALVFLCGALGGAGYTRLAPAAKAVELVHASTLVHDDVIDHSATRRGAPTVAASAGEGTAIVVGDYYFARAYGEAARTGDVEVVAALAGAVMNVCEGELRQQAERYRYRPGFYRYFRRIRLKTASLLETACVAGSRLAGIEADEGEALRLYGLYLGLAFQVADDLLDYVGEEQEVGKPVGHDLLEGSATLPLMLARDDAEVAQRLAELLPDKTPLEEPAVAEVVALVRRSRGPAQTRARAVHLADLARGALAPVRSGAARDALSALTTYVVERSV